MRVAGPQLLSAFARDAEGAILTLVARRLRSQLFFVPSAPAERNHLKPEGYYAQFVREVGRIFALAIQGYERFCRSLEARLD